MTTSNLFTGAMDALHDQSLPTIELLQTSLPHNKQFMIGVSILFDPRYVFLVYAPILFALNKRVAHRMIIALTLTEWSNQILKWLLAGERPYWYVHERAVQLAQIYANQSQAEEIDWQLTQLKQFPVTCELGAGSPSGHAMVTATVWYVLVDAYLKGELPLLDRVDYSAIKVGQQVGKLVSKLSWSAYAMALVLVSLSRVYLACHFPHQCLCGAILGVAVARFVVERVPMERLQRGHFCLATAAMLASALGTYGALRSLGLNPLWSVDKGMRWCVDPAYIHLDTTPFASMTRYLGVCLGAGLAYSWPQTPSAEPSGQKLVGHLLLARRSLAALLSIGFGQLLLALPLSRSNLNLYYVISFCLYVIFAYAIARPIPSFAKELTSEDSSETKEKSM